MARSLEERLEFYRQQPNNLPRVPFRQVLAGARKAKSQFWAILIDPDTQKQIGKVMIYEAEPDECVELAIGRFTILPEE